MEIKKKAFFQTSTVLPSPEIAGWGMHFGTDKSLQGKLYSLLKDGSWLLKGKGEVSLQVSEGKAVLTLLQEGQKEFFRDSIDPHNEYMNDIQHLIYWKKPDSNEETALRFNTKEETEKFWDRLDSALKTISGWRAIIERGPLAEPSFENLGLMIEQISDFRRSAAKCSQMIDQVLACDGYYLSMLFRSFVNAEHFQSISKLSLLFLVLKELINVSDERVITTLLSDKFFMSSLGVLEYDSDINIYLPMNSYRKFFTTQLIFNNPIGIENEAVLSRIHLAYRLHYLKDTAAARWLEDSTKGVLIGMIDELESEIVEYFFHLEDTVCKVVDDLGGNNLFTMLLTTRFLYELCIVSQRIKDEEIPLFFTRLLEANFLTVVGRVMAIDGSLMQLSEEERIEFSRLHSVISVTEDEIILKHTGSEPLDQLKRWLAEILTIALRIVPLKVKERLTSPSERAAEYPLMAYLFNIFINFRSDGLRYEIFELLKILFVSPTDLQENYLIEIFFSRFASQLVAFLLKPKKRSTTKTLILDLFYHLAGVHSSLMRSYCLQTNALIQVSSLLNCRQKVIKMSVIRLFKQIVSSGDPALRHHLASSGVLQSILAASATAKRDNCIRSAFQALLKAFASSSDSHMYTPICLPNPIAPRSLPLNFHSIVQGDQKILAECKSNSISDICFNERTSFLSQKRRSPEDGYEFHID